jgi:hypothetical protein
MSFTFSPAIIAYSGVSVVAGAVTFPTTGAVPIVWPGVGSTINFPKANCRQIIILNTGATTIFFGSIFAQSFADLPPPFNPASPAIVPQLGSNCTSIPAGGSLAIELNTFEKRGQFDPGTSTITTANFEPLSLIYFAAAPATNATATLTYINTNGPF